MRSKRKGGRASATNYLLTNKKNHPGFLLSLYEELDVGFTDEGDSLVAILLNERAPAHINEFTRWNVKSSRLQCGLSAYRKHNENTEPINNNKTDYPPIIQNSTEPNYPPVSQDIPSDAPPAETEQNKEPKLETPEMFILKALVNQIESRRLMDEFGHDFSLNFCFQRAKDYINNNE